jgi:alpha-1,6-mannosyltransferase
VHSELQAGAAGMATPLRLPAQHALRLMQRRGLDGPDAVIATSPSVARRLRDLSDAHIHVSPLGVDGDVFRPRAADAVLRRTLADPNETLLLHAGRLSPEKRPELLIDMLGELRDGYVLALVGTGPAEAALRSRARELGVLDAVRFVGHIDDRRLLAVLLQTSDAFVHANPGETFGLAPLEALACGTRVIVPDDAGVAETPAGLLMTRVRPGSARALADGVRAALQEPRPVPDLDRMGWRACFDREWALYGLLAGRAADATIAA